MNIPQGYSLNIASAAIYCCYNLAEFCNMSFVWHMQCEKTFPKWCVTRVLLLQMKVSFLFNPPSIYGLILYDSSVCFSIIGVALQPHQQEVSEVSEAMLMPSLNKLKILIIY